MRHTIVTYNETPMELHHLRMIQSEQCRPLSKDFVLLLGLQKVLLAQNLYCVEFPALLAPCQVHFPIRPLPYNPHELKVFLPNLLGILYLCLLLCPLSPVRLWLYQILLLNLL